MRNRSFLVFVLVMLLLPVQAFAAGCFRATTPGGTKWDIKVTVEGSAEEFFNLVGEGIHVSCAATESAPLNGAAHLRSDGKAHFNVVFGGTSHCFPAFIQGILNPPAFNTGSGTVDIPSVTFVNPATGVGLGFSAPVTITSLSTCPPLP